MKIVEFNQNNIIGRYDDLNDVVIINEKLKKFPRLYKFILEHEVNHAMHRTNFLYHCKLDLQDMKRLYIEFRQDWKEFKKIQYKTMFKKDLKRFLGMFFYITFFQILLLIFMVYYKYFNSEKL